MDITKTYGIKVFSDAVMSQRLPRDVYESLKLTQRMGTELDSTIAGAVAAAMRDWAVENGATHYSHWFQPMTNITAGNMRPSLCLIIIIMAMLSWSSRPRI